MPDESFPLRTLFRAFPGIPLDEARALIRSGKIKNYTEGAVLCQEDAFESTFYIILEGGVQVSKKVDATGAEIRVLKMLGPGDFFGEMALVQEAPRAATVSTMQPTRVLEIYKEDFQELINEIPSLSRALMLAVVKRLRENDAMAIEDLRIKAQELADAYQRLAELEFARRDFLTTIAHELRNPLTAANSSLQIAENGMAHGQNIDNATLRSAVGTASRQIEHVITLVNDLLFIQEMDLILPRFNPVDLGELTRRVVENSAPRQKENTVRVHLQLPSKPAMVSGDATTLQRAIEAIIDNAIKFSYPGGSVNITLGSQDGMVCTEVCDHGVGITEDALPRIFDRFFHTEQAGGRVFTGAGLGLSIAKQVIEQHKGKIIVDSRFGEGTTVRVELPAANKGN